MITALVILCWVLWILSLFFLVRFLRWKKKAKDFETEVKDLKAEKSKLSDSVRQKGTELTSAENKTKRLQRELDEK